MKKRIINQHNYINIIHQKGDDKIHDKILEFEIIIQLN